MTSWIHTRWHRLILRLLLRTPRSLWPVSQTGKRWGEGCRPKPWGHGDMWDCDGWLLQITSRFNEGKALVGPSSPPVSMKLPFPPLGWIRVVRPVPGITGVPGTGNDKVLLFTFLLQISDCLKLNFWVSEIESLSHWHYGIQFVELRGKKHRVIKLIHLNCFNFKWYKRWQNKITYDLEPVYAEHWTHGLWNPSNCSSVAI